MKKFRLLITVLMVGLIALLVAGCGAETASENKAFGTENTQVQERGQEMGYKSITMAEAKEIFKAEGDYIILDVRRPDEYREGHIPGAINYANEDITDKELSILPDKAQTVYVYCRSGRRSQDAAGKLSKIGYTGIIECGGILDWTGEKVTE